jgi:acyl carrier protein
MMPIEEFTQKIEAEFENVEPGSVGPDTPYREIESWTSMHALIIIAFIDSEFDILLRPEELKNTNTIRDLYQLVQSKK